MLTALLACAPLATGCAADPADRTSTVILASTTSTEDSGLFEALIPAFQRDHPGIRVRVVAVGSGQALAIGRRRDADVLLVHSPAAESTFVADGHADSRTTVMRNDFVLVGSGHDPARVRAAADAPEALRRIASASALFISRGDDSGTHTAELALWNAAGLAPPRHPVPGQDRRPPPTPSPWYLDAGQGMADVLRIASERQAYTLSDRATYTALRAALDLEILFQDDAALANPYSVITVRGAHNAAGARAFADWLAGPAGQAVIARFGRDRFGHPLFIPVPTPVDSAGH